MINFIGNVTLLLAIFYILILLFFYNYQTKLLLHPDKTMEPLLDSSYDQINFISGGSKIHGLLSDKYSDRPMVLFSHGNAGNLSHRIGVMNTFEHLQLNFLIYDYRGFGLSEGVITQEKELYEDGLSAWKFLVEKKAINPSKIIIWGRSLGAAIAAKIATEHPDAKALVLDCPFSNIKQVGSYHYPYLPISLLTKYSMDNIAAVQKLHMPVVVSHSTDDQIIPFSLGKKVFNEANQPKLFIQLEGGHNDGFDRSFIKYTTQIADFLK